MLFSEASTSKENIDQVRDVALRDAAPITAETSISESHNWPLRSLLSWRREKVESSTTRIEDYTQPPPRRITAFDNDLPPPAYQKEKTLRQQDQTREETWKCCLFMIIGALILSVAYLLNLIDWLSQTISCYGSNLSIILTMTGISVGFHLAEAIVVGILTLCAHRSINQPKNHFGGIILVVSTFSFLYSLFSSIILLLIMYLTMNDACLFTGKDRLFLETWLLAVISFIFHLSFLIRGIFISILKRSIKPRGRTPNRIFTIENPPSYFEQIPQPPKYTP